MTRCLLCGATDDIAMGLIRWRDGVPRLFTSDYHCKDAKACRDRVEARGEEWPVESSPASIEREAVAR